MTSRLMSSCYGITLVERFCISPIYHFDPIGWGKLEDLVEVTKATSAVTGNITQSHWQPVLTIEWVSNCFTNSPELPCSTSSTIVLNAASYKSRSRHLRAKGAQRKFGSKKRGLVSEECRKKNLKQVRNRLKNRLFRSDVLRNNLFRRNKSKRIDRAR